VGLGYIIIVILRVQHVCPERCSKLLTRKLKVVNSIIHLTIHPYLAYFRQQSPLLWKYDPTGSSRTRTAFKQ